MNRQDVISKQRTGKAIAANTDQSGYQAKIC